MRPVGETEFVNGVAAMSAAGGYGTTKVCAGIVGHADLRLGARVQRGAGGAYPRRRRPLPRHPPHHRLGRRSDADEPGLRAAARADGRRDVPRGLRRLAPLNLTFDAWLYHPQIDELTALARAFPDTRDRA